MAALVVRFRPASEGAAVFGRLLNDLNIDRSPHGFRSSFRSWCSDEGIDCQLAGDVLPHAVESQVEQRYARSDVLERRREVVESWGHCCNSSSTGDGPKVWASDRASSPGVLLSRR